MTAGNRPLLTIVTSADQRFFPGVAVAVASAVKAASGHFDYQILILDGGIAAEDFSSLSVVVDEIARGKGISASVAPLTIDESSLAALPERRGSRMFYAKLVLPVALSHLDSIVYLDADVLCFAGVEEVRPTGNPDDFLLAGALDFFSTIERDCPWIDQVPPDERKLPYINSGIMWMNLKRLREMDFTAKAIATRASVQSARHADQAVINFLCRGKTFILRDSINHRTTIGSAQPLCAGSLDLNIHYIGSPKPWLGAPKTSHWLAHQLWHQAYAALFSKQVENRETGPPHDLKSVRQKALIYSILNPKRAAHYRCDLRSLKDPGGVLKKAALHWSSLPDA